MTQLGHARDLQEWGTIFCSVLDAYTSAPRASVRHISTLVKLTRTEGRIPSWSQRALLAARISFSGSLRSTAHIVWVEDCFDFLYNGTEGREGLGDR